jgi:NADH-quinone oxidoreductase subunit A
MCSGCRPREVLVRTTGGVEALEHYMNNYVLVAIFVAIGVFLPVAALTLGRFLRPHKPTVEKQTTYESGNDPVGSGQVRFNVRYYLFALMFVIFDVEAVFLYPWAVAYDKLGLFAVVEMLIFVALLVIGLIYAWKKKVLKWTSM